MSAADPNAVIVTGENPFVRLSPKDNDDYTTNASFWRIVLSPAGPGHVLYLKSELTENRWSIYADNIAMARWLQRTVQGMLNEELADTTIPVSEAVFSKTGTALFGPVLFWALARLAAFCRSQVIASPQPRSTGTGSASCGGLAVSD